MVFHAHGIEVHLLCYVHSFRVGLEGVVRDEAGGVPRWDEMLKCKCDIDATLQELLDTRLVWNEARFCFAQERDKNLGGNSLFRSAGRIAAEKRQFKRKWQAHIRFESYRTTTRRGYPFPAVSSATARGDCGSRIADRGSRALNSIRPPSGGKPRGGHPSVSSITRR